MTIFYTLDRMLSLTTGIQLDLTASACPVTSLQTHALSRFDNGVSRHANNLFFNSNINLVQSEAGCSSIIEILLEERRRASFPEKPSRFQSIFACSTIQGVAWFRGSSKCPIDTPIFEVYASTGWHRGDMNLLNMNCTPTEFSYRLDLYWQGITYKAWDNYSPFWEIVIPLPARIGKKIQE
ncbi:hypothetical protein ACNSO7_27110 [Yersinia enterocolitica]|uniref:hypothetical protein n=1 Tax=Yersinia enterocolitica TaxID=630 RepID=UPI003AB2F519